MPTLTFLDKNYHLGSFNRTNNPTREFVPQGEDVKDWTTPLTVIDRPDARTKEDFDRLAQGVLNNYKSHGGQILMARTLTDGAGAAFNYMVAAFEQPDRQRYELNFVRDMLGPENGAILVYGVHIGDPPDYRAKAKDFLDHNTGEVGHALGQLALPDLGRLPRRVF